MRDVLFRFEGCLCRCTNEKINSVGTMQTQFILKACCEHVSTQNIGSLLVSGTESIHCLPGPRHAAFPAISYVPTNKTFSIPSAYSNESGLFCESDNLVLFCREQFAVQMNFMKEKVMNSCSIGWILGSPGTGKSCAAFSFLTSELDNNSWIFTWMYFDSARVRCVRFNKNQKEVTRLRYDLESLRKYLNVEGADGKKHFLFLDGYVMSGPRSAKICEFADECEEWLLENRDMHRLCIICSMSYRGKSKLDEDRQKRIETLYVSSWMLNEYRKAFAEEQVLECFGENLDAGIEEEDPADIEQLVLSKFYFAGSSARFMFSCKTALVMKDLRSALKSCHDIVPYLDGTIGEQSILAVNRLLSTFVQSEDHVFHSLVSRFVALELSLKQGPEMVKRIAQALRTSDNPALEEFLFEMWFFALIGREDLRLEPAGTYTNERVLELDPTKNVDRPSANRVWYKPLKWNQGGYDAIHIDHQERVVTFVQITISMKHSLKLVYFASLIRKLSFTPSIVEILCLVPHQIASTGQFRVSGVTGLGLLKDFVNKDQRGWASNQEQHMVQICSIPKDWNANP